MSVKIKIIILVSILIAAGATAFWLWPEKTAPEAGGADKNEYKSELFNFSFTPPNSNLQEFDDENGHVILGSSFQIFITPFDETGPITPERIKKDLPNAVVENPTPTKVGPSTGSGQADALSFIGQGDGFKTAEVWFVWPPEPYPNGNYLYQITAKVEDAKLLEGIISTWSFQ
ncbi:TPA: hypothetical protein DEB04_00890 [Candidatus Giovannonibacteria bacterium]|nr:MAG: hypothetical protein A3D61_02260 [Candidatus Giovannonibacteria bacterium RIFCSPHIGHO2_02_FULL_48_15]OGF95405.1 MAG: hypothetical protein A2433_00625 [Candidatus Giovannonibacteria bacterium RIFOXYC1_FULL_48_8]OGF96021.1 MAG: hypothetical protein A2613_00410 [Candidatus Giovannonibacteria bacterium RIFOXYD1_FULL_48_21]HBT81265.1 hypothetical protein [Candidatus Giovannonibacteria bacterium]